MYYIYDELNNNQNQINNDNQNVNETEEKNDMMLYSLKK